MGLAEFLPIAAARARHRFGGRPLQPQGRSPSSPLASRCCHLAAPCCSTRARNPTVGRGRCSASRSPSASRRAFQAPAMRAMPPMVAPDGGAAEGDRAVLGGVDRRDHRRPGDRWVPLRRRSVGRLSPARRALIFVSLLVLSTQTFLRQPLPPDPDNRPTLRTAVEGLRVHPPHTGAAGSDRSRPLRGPVRRSRGTDPRDRQGPARRRRCRLRLAARCPRFRRGGDGHVPRGPPGTPPRRQDTARSPSACSASAPSCSA